MYYDPMIAKLCSWGADRGAALEVMRNALDEFEVEGIGHNLPFLSAVMDHPKFITGDMTTAFIAEEYPEGFEGVNLPEDVLRRLAAGAAAMRLVTARREGRISGTYNRKDHPAPSDWVVSIGDHHWPVTAQARDHRARDDGRGGGTESDLEGPGPAKAADPDPRAGGGGCELCRRVRDHGRGRLDPRRQPDHGDDRRDPDVREGRAPDRGLPHPLSRRGPGGEGEDAAGAELAAPDAREAAARYLEDAALPDAGAGREDQRRGGRRGAGGPGAGDRRGG